MHKPQTHTEKNNFEHLKHNNQTANFTMRKLFYTAFIAIFAFATNTKAQEVFNTVMESANSALKNPVQSFSKTQMARFKIDELNYIKSKSDTMETEKRNWLMDVQAYYMSEFLSRYLTEIIYNEGQPDSVKKAMVYLFVNASAICPLFNDTDKAKINKYINTDKTLTPFCLDTDWEKAYKVVNKAME